MARISANGIEIEYEQRGDPQNKPLVLIMGLGSQMTRWPDPFLDLLAERGFHVTRFDNRDAGLTTHIHEAGLPDMRKILAARATGKPAEVPYLLDDMARDTAAFIEALGLQRAHIAGVSMGGMIAQLLAADHPERVLSLTSIMSTTGHPDLPGPTPEAQAMLTTPAPDPARDLEGFLARAVRSSQIIGSPRYPQDETEIRARAEADYRRAYDPAGFARQYAAILASPHRREKLAKVSAPAVVIHGTDDTLVNVEGGRDTAAHIPNADLRLIEGMGHDIPPGLYEILCDGITAAATKGNTAPA